jgi:hypothetical protein
MLELILRDVTGSTCTGRRGLIVIHFQQWTSSIRSEGYGKRLRKSEGSWGRKCAVWFNQK